MDCHRLLKPSCVCKLWEKQTPEDLHTILFSVENETFRNTYPSFFVEGVNFHDNRTNSLVASISFPSNETLKTVKLWDCRKIGSLVEPESYDATWQISYNCSSGTLVPVR